MAPIKVEDSCEQYLFSKCFKNYQFGLLRTFGLIINGLCLTISPLISQALADQPRTKVLPEGSHWVLSTRPSDQVHVHNTKTIRVKDHSQSLTIIAQSAGEALLTVGRKIYDVQVIKQRKFRLYNVLKTEIKTLKGLDISVKDSMIYITGQLHRMSDWINLSQLTRFTLEEGCLSICYQWKASVDKDIEKDVLAYFNKVLPIMDRHFYKIEYTPSPKIHLFQAVVKHYPDIESIIHSYGIIPTIHEKNFQNLPQIRIQLLIVELTKSWKQKLGVAWSSEFSTQILPVIQDHSSLYSQLQLFEDQGLGQILASPSLIAQSGSTASFLAGGEFPIRISGYKTKDIIWKKHGVLVTIKPKINISGKIEIKVDLELSIIDPGQSIDGIPGMKTHRISSNIQSQNHHTTILTSLLKQFQGQSNNLVPYLTKLPIIGRLFQSNDFLRNKSDFVVFVTPHLVASGQNDKTNLPKGWRSFEEP